MLSKKWFATSVFIILLLYSSLPVSNAFEGQETTIPFDLNQDQQDDYTLSIKGWAAEVEPEVQKVSYPYATYTHYIYKQAQDYFRLTVVDMKNGDIFYTARNYPSVEENEIRLSVVAHESSPTARVFSPAQKGFWDPVSQTQLPDIPAGWRTLENLPFVTTTSLYLDSEQLHYRIGHVDVFKPLGYSVFQELVTQEPETEIIQNEDKDVTYTLSLKAGDSFFSDTWGILSTKPLVSWDNPTAANEALQVEIDKKFSLDGAFYQTPSNYRPYEKNSYYLNPANVIGLRFLHRIDAENSNGTLFEDMATHLAYMSVQRQNPEGFWPTMPRSLWLSGDYNIEFDYMDNRRNADNVTFLMRYLYQKPDFAIQSTLKNWDQYLQAYIKKHAVPVPEGGVLVPDYVGDENAKTSHISLNHHLSNLNYLLESYMIDKDPSKLELAEQLLKGVENTAFLWVMPNHNLYYALTPELKPYKPNEYPDYATLTRDDLEETQRLLTKMGKVRNPKLQFLIDQKNIWLNNR